MSRLYLKNNPGYHVATIEKGVYGEASKIVEEISELVDALEQGSNVMALIELSDLYGAMKGYLQKHHPTISMQDLSIMSQITERAFKNGSR